MSGLPFITIGDGERLIDEGDPPGNVYVLRDGKLAVSVAGREVRLLDVPGTVVGEISAMLACPSTATVSAAAETTLYIITDIREFLSAHRDAAEDISRNLCQRLLNTGHTSLLPLPMLLAQEAAPIRELAAGTRLCEQGAPATALYVLRRGAVRILADGRELGDTDAPGTTFGEIAFLTGTEHTATVEVTADAQFFEVDADAAVFAQPAARALARALAQRLLDVVAEFTAFKAELISGGTAEDATPGLARRVYDSWDALMAVDVLFSKGSAAAASNDA
jgi:CRP-like cAMP-binding protein